jgi:lipoprotein-releasing system permease protein
MYTLLLSWRYLRTRWIALASIISVTLGVATMIVVNSVMAGFTHEMRDRLHKILSDVVVESYSLSGFPDPQKHMEDIQSVAGEYIAGMTPTVVVPGMLSFQFRGQWQTRQVNFIGIDSPTVETVSEMREYLQHPLNREHLSFDLREEGYDVKDHQATGEVMDRYQMEGAGWRWRRWWAERDKAARSFLENEKPKEEAANSDPEPQVAQEPVADPLDGAHQAEEFDPGKEQFTGIVLGIGLVSYRDHDGSDKFLILPGDDVKVTVPTAGTPPKAKNGTFTVVDYYESKMNEYDSTFVFVPLEKLQEMRGMIDPTTKVTNITAIQIKLKNPADGELVRDKLRRVLSPQAYAVNTWRDKQGALLAAVQMETAILNVLLFMIIAVAGFGILAIFFMIVVEKTKDIGVLKSLGASAQGVMAIFLAYGVSLGAVGAGAGLVLGLLFVKYINQIADLLGRLTGHQVFDPAIYYFQKIPTIVEPFTVAWVVAGALVIAVLASVLPARRAARLHPVQALRYE